MCWAFFFKLKIQLGHQLSFLGYEAKSELSGGGTQKTPDSIWVSWASYGQHSRAHAGGALLGLKMFSSSLSF